MSASVPSRVAMAFRAHSGWAVLVSVCGSITSPTVIQRQRVSLAASGRSHTVQPFHAARSMALDDARAFLGRCADDAKAMAKSAILDAIDNLNKQKLEISAACILMRSGKATQDLAAILRSHPLIHTAEGEFFRDALKSACEACSLPVSRVPEQKLVSLSAAAFSLDAEEVQRRLFAIGKSIGPPWRQDEKVCALAGWLTLASFSNPQN
jgi:hypothetical protein